MVAVYVQSPLCWGIHTGAQQADIQSAADLDGKVWAVSRMTSGSHLMAVVLAQQQGWDHTALKYEFVGNLAGAKGALTATPPAAHGFLWEKFTTKPLVDAGDLRRVGEIPTPWPCFVLSVREAFLTEHAAAVRAVVAAVAGECAALKVAADAPAVIAARYKLQEEDITAWLSAVEWSCATARDDVMLRKVGETLAQLQILPQAPAPETLWHAL